MPSASYYTPQLDRELVTMLYHTAKSRQVPMTKLASALVREGLLRLGSIDAGTAIVQEEPSTADPGGQ